MDGKEIDYVIKNYGVCYYSEHFMDRKEELENVTKQLSFLIQECDRKISLYEAKKKDYQSLLKNKKKELKRCR